MPGNSMQIITNNRNLLPQRDKFKNRLGSYKKDVKTEYNLPKATAKQLKDIGKRLKSERKANTLKVITLTIIGYLVLICIIAFLGDGIRNSLWF